MAMNSYLSLIAIDDIHFGYVITLVARGGYYLNGPEGLPNVCYVCQMYARQKS